MYREHAVLQALGQFNVERVIFAVRQAAATKKLEPPKPPDILKGRIRGAEG